MRVERQDGNIVIYASLREARIITSSMNEVCHGVSIPKSEFPSRIGAEKAEVVSLLDEIMAVAKQM